MRYIKLSKKEIHINYLKNNISNINFKEYNLFTIIYIINKLFNNYIHKISIKINYLMINKDFRLLWRESSLFLSFLLKIRTVQPSKNYIYSKLPILKKLKYLNLIQNLNISLQTLLIYNLIANHNNFLENQYKKNKKKEHSQPNYFRKMLIRINYFQIKTIWSNKNFSIIRSPFVYSKSKESFGSYEYALLISLKNFPNIFTSLYFSRIRSYYNKYSLPLYVKYLK